MNNSLRIERLVFEGAFGFLCVLVFMAGLFRAERIWFDDFNRVNVIEAFTISIAPDLGFAFAWFGLFLLFSNRSIGRAVVIGVGGLFLMLSIVAQQYFLTTGSPVHWDMVLYFFRRFDQTGSIAKSGVSPLVGIHLSIALAILVVATILWSKAKTEKFRNRNTAGIVLCFGSLFLTLNIFSLSPAPVFLEPFHQTSSLHEGFEDQGKDEIRYEAPVVQPNGVIKRPNIVVLVLESVRRDIVFPYGPDSIRKITPFLSSLVEDAIIVRNAYTTTSHTSKALVGLLCGMYPNPKMSIQESKSLPLACMPKLLSEVGYESLFIQSALGEFEDRTDLTDLMGFDKTLTQEDLVSPDFPKVGYLGMDDHSIVGPAIEFLQNRESPGFVTMLTSVSHHPYHIPTDQSFDPKEPPSLAYAKAVNHIDDVIRIFFQELKSTGLINDTVVFLVGDHGEAFGEHGRFQHDAVPYLEGTAVPMILYGGKWAPGPMAIEGTRSHLDLLPTALELAQVNWVGETPGRSLLTTKGHEAVYTSCWYEGYCSTIYSGDKAIVYHYGHRPAEVFDLRDDPTQLKPRAESSMDQPLIDKMHRVRRSVRAFYRKHSDNG